MHSSVENLYTEDRHRLSIKSCQLVQSSLKGEYDKYLRHASLRYRERSDKRQLVKSGTWQQKTESNKTFKKLNEIEGIYLVNKELYMEEKHPRIYENHELRD